MITFQGEEMHNLYQAQFFMFLLAVLFLVLQFSILSVMAAGSNRTFFVRGIGGGGFFSPSVSPFDEKFMLVSSDMSGVYYSHDGDESLFLAPSDNFSSAAGSTPPAYFSDRVFWYSQLSPFVNLDKELALKKR